MGQRTGDPACKLVLLALANCHNPHTGLCFPSNKALADDAEMHESTVRRHLKTLAAIGLIARKRRTNVLGHRISDAYEFIGFDFRPSGKSSDEDGASAVATERGKAKPKRANRAVGKGKAYRADCALGTGQNGEPNVVPTAQLCSLHIEPKPVEPNLSITNSEPETARDGAEGDTGPNDADAEAAQAEPGRADPLSAALRALRRMIGTDAWTSWIEPLIVVSVDPPILEAPTRFHADYIRTVYAERLERLLGRGRIEIRISQAHAVRSGKGQRAGEAAR